MLSRNDFSFAALDELYLERMEVVLAELDQRMHPMSRNEYELEADGLPIKALLCVIADNNARLLDYVDERLRG